MVVFLYMIWIVIVLSSSYKGVMRYGILIVVEPHGPHPYFLSFVLLPLWNDANLFICYLWLNLPKSLARHGGLLISSFSDTHVILILSTLHSAHLST